MRSSADPEQPLKVEMARRLNSWKAIANHFGRTVRTVQRWEKEEGLPVYRHVHKAQSSVYSYVDELDAWWTSRNAPRGWTFSWPDRIPPVPALTAVFALLAVLSLSTLWFKTALRDSAYQPRPDASLLLAIGQDHARQGNWVQAVEAFEEAISIDTAFGAAYGNLAIARANQSARVMDRIGFDDAMAAAERALSIDAESVEANTALGIIALHVGEQQSAEESFDAALQSGRDLADTHYWYSVLLRERGRFDEAHEELEATLAIDPLHAKANEALAISYWIRGSYAAASARYSVLLNLRDPPPEALHKLSELNKSYGKFEDALAWAKETMLRYPLYRGFQALPVSYLRLDMPNEAARWMEYLRLAEGPNPPRLGIWSRYHFMLGDFEAAYQLKEDYLARASTPTSDLPFEVQASFGAMAVATGRYDEGIATLAPLFVEDFRVPSYLGASDNSALLFAEFLPFAYRQTGRVAEAIEVSEKIQTYIEMLRDAGVGYWPDLYVTEARNQVLLGNKAEALEALAKAVDLGWRDYVFERHNPIWAQLRGNERFEQLLTRVREDVAAQRARVEAAGRDYEFESEVLRSIGVAPGQASDL